MKKYKKSHLKSTLIFFLSIGLCTHIPAENPSFDIKNFKTEPFNHSALLGVWKSRDLSVPIEIKISSLDQQSVRGTLKLENKELKFHKSIWVSKIPQEYSYKFIYEIHKPKRGAGRYTFFPHLADPNRMRGIYTDVKGNDEYFTLQR
ncbi:hypothetical protein G9F32_10190 [Acinetobacter sp. 194]|uniref:hypothetical protein n=1 Tax=Acinetobacter shaoyimingii TaxID=2715164 RepID=UPI0014075E6E|nr:hypothetical protein [Acinetobacter shaoyimingii]NHB58378.1 hypothetical protein [Acinetobacter shaoyimingii]